MKGEYEYGVTTFGDGANHKVSLTAGTAFGEVRGHVLLSGEYFDQKGIQSIDRDWNDAGFFQIDNPAYSAAACTDSSAATPCVNARLIQKGIGTGTFAPGGLILNSTANPASLRGTYFGTVNPATGRATTGTAVFGPQSGQWMVGGDYRLLSEGHAGSATLLPSETRKSAFARLSWEFSPAFNVFGQFSYAYYRGASFYQQTPTTPVTIRVDNAYLPDSVRAAMVAAGASTIQIGTSNIGIPPQGSNNKRETFRYVAGADGEFDAIGRGWRWDAYYQKGETKTDELLTNAWNISRMAQATDAVVVTAANAGTSGLAPGSIACRSTLTNPGNGCVPLNRIGLGGMSQAAINYVLYDGLQPLREQTLKQDVVAANLSTNSLFELPAGGVSLAFGAEYRKESVDGFVDPLFQPLVANGVTSGTWIYGNYLPTIGSYNVKEAYVETIIPVFRGLDLNGAFRITDYSTSGQVETWKVGVTWQVIDDVKVRGTISRDIRAPNLGELFAPGTGRTNTVNVPQPGGALRADQFNESTVGNPDLQPEVARTYGAGIVFTPTFLPGFAASVDYYKIDLKDTIASVTAQTLVDQCYIQNITESCSFISTTGGRGVVTPGLAVTSIEIKPINFVSLKSQGIDFEASYRRAIGPGSLALRALASYAIERVTNNGIDVPTDAAGENSGSLPDWTFRLSAAYTLESGFSFQAVGRGVSDGVYDNSYIVCTTGCPLSTVANRTVNTNRIPGAWYLDLNADYRFEIAGVGSTAFVSIRNVLNTDPVLVANGPTGNNTPAYPQTNRNLYDVLGRVFRIGLRVEY